MLAVLSRVEDLKKNAKNIECFLVSRITESEGVETPLLPEFHGFDNDMGLSVDKEWRKHILKKPREVIEEVLDMKEAPSRRGNQNRKFLIKRLGLRESATKNPWISEEELKRRIVLFMTSTPKFSC